MWQQDKPSPPLQESSYVLLWSTRGKLTKVQDLKTAKELMKKRWKAPTNEELEKFKIGGYNPLYDLGEIKEDDIGTPLQYSQLGTILDVIVI